MILEFFPPAALALNEEVKNHPLLLAALSEMAATNGGQLDMELMVGGVAAYCNIELNDYYTEEDLELLFNVLVTKLKQKSAIVIH